MPSLDLYSPPPDVVSTTSLQDLVITSWRLPWGVYMRNLVYGFPRRPLSGNPVNRGVCLHVGRLLAKELSEGRYELLGLLDVG